MGISPEAQLIAAQIAAAGSRSSRPTGEAASGLVITDSAADRVGPEATRRTSAPLAVAKADHHQQATAARRKTKKISTWRY
jgi:hypothetical protein